jgi:hypothetical protein
VVAAWAVSVGGGTPNKGPSAVVLLGCSGGQEGRKRESCWQAVAECTSGTRNVTEQEIKLQLVGSVNLRVFIIYFIVCGWMLPLFALR